MATIYEIHPQNPQDRLVNQVVNVLNLEGVIAYPTSSGYALGCRLDNLEGVARIRSIRKLEEKQDFTLMCSSISQASKFAKIDNSNFKLLKNLDVDKFTFLLKTMPELPKKTQSKRGTVGIRIAYSKALQRILETLDEPILSTSLLVPNEDGIEKGHRIHQGFSRGLDLISFSTAHDVQNAIGSQIEAIINSGEVHSIPTTVVDLSNGDVEIIRQGSGEL